MGHRNPCGMAAMREVKAEGGWSVVFTEVCEVHPSGDVSPNIEARLWADRDIPALAMMCDAVHKHGALASALSFDGRRNKVVAPTPGNGREGGPPAGPGR
jgi:dimethylamine/trimethylamine dehydrogenase